VASPVRILEIETSDPYSGSFDKLVTTLNYLVGNATIQRLRSFEEMNFSRA